ncbi:MAG: inorganic triphosphatase [Alphaproteobacteria bacterium]|nr:MAG: inorganic triphosphatase [Alphaproteobacteria bacterium]
MAAGRTEFELKLELGEDDIATIAGSAPLAEMTNGAACRRRLRSTYFDTAERTLERAGVSLRIRETEAGRVQTVKVGTEVAGGVSNPIEDETPTTRTRPHPGAIGDEKLRGRLVDLVDFTALRPVFRTDIDRVTHRLVGPGVEAELSFDTGRLVAGRRSEPISEVELELLSGDIDAFCELVLRLFGDVPIRLSTRSKAGRGYDLIAGGAARPGPARAATPPLRADDEVAGAFAAVCAAAATQILDNWSRLACDKDPEIAHQLRIGLRRLRTALRVFRPAIDSPTLRDMRRDLAEVGRIVGNLRNADVMLGDIVRPALGDPASRDAADRVVALLARHCGGERERVAATLAGPRWNRLALRVALLPHGAGWSTAAAGGEVGRLAAIALGSCWKKVCRRGRKLERLDDAGRHQLRKDLKTLRYAAEFFAPMLPAGKCGRFLRRLKTLQDGFGYLNDVVLAGTLPGMLPDDLRADPAVQRTVGFVLGWHRALAEREWASARERWRRLARQQLPWT